MQKITAITILPRTGRALVALHGLSEADLAARPAVALAEVLSVTPSTAAKRIRELRDLGLLSKTAHRGGVRLVPVRLTRTVEDTSDENGVLRGNFEDKICETLDLFPLGREDLGVPADASSMGSQSIDSSGSVPDGSTVNGTQEAPAERVFDVVQAASSVARTRDTGLATATWVLTRAWGRCYDRRSSSGNKPYRAGPVHRHRLRNAAVLLLRRHVPLAKFEQYVRFVWDTIGDRRYYPEPYITDLYAEDSQILYFEKRGRLVIDLFALEVALLEAGFRKDLAASPSYMLEVATSVRKNGRQGIYPQWENGRVVAWLITHWHKLPRCPTDEYERKARRHQAKRWKEREADFHTQQRRREAERRDAGEPDDSAMQEFVTGRHETRFFDLAEPVGVNWG